MITVTLALSEEAYRTIRQAVQVRGLSGNLAGAVDAVATRIVEAIERGETDVTLKTREEREKEGGTPCST